MADRSTSPMPSLEAKRTLVKSPPEIWAEVSDAGALARHLGEFGEIRITRTQPESVVEWEGDLASGCVRIEPSGWGTRVTLTAEAPDAPEPAPPPEPEPVAEPPRQSWWARLRRRREAPVAEVAPPPPPPPPEPVLDGERAQATLTGVLDTLGAAHHRPFSRP
jgi:hypothetical protein